MQTGLYRITCLTNNKFYIVQSKNIDRRWLVHMRLLRLNKHHNRILQNCYNKYGLIAFEFTVVESCTEDQLDIKEQAMLDEHHGTPLCMNLSSSAINPVAGLVRTAEWKRKIGEGNKGKVRSPEFRQILREANLGKKHSLETRRKISEKLKGTVFTEERCRNISKALTGKKLSAEHVMSLRTSHGYPVLGYNKISDEELEFINMSFAAEYFGCTPAAIKYHLARGTCGSRGKLKNWTFRSVS